jgi:hypothetical protein
MSHHLAKLAIAFVTFIVATPLMAAPSTSSGLMSVAQVTERLENAPADRTAQQVLTAYLVGVGEAASVVVSMGKATCRTSMSLNAANVDHALSSVARGHETPATALIVRDMLKRAGCTRQ